MNSLRFSLGNIPIEVQPSFWLLVIILGLQESLSMLLLWVAVVFSSLLVHELGHAVAFRRFGHSPRIVLYAMGGLTFGSAAPLTDRQRLLVSLAGPAAGFVVGLLVLGVFLTAPLPVEGTLATLVAMLLWVNLGWGLLNLLPIQPLDGAQALASLLNIVGIDGRLWTLRATLPMVGVGGALALWGGQYWLAFIAGWAGYQAIQSLRHLHAGRADQALLPELEALGQRLQREPPSTALYEAGQDLRARAQGAALQGHIDLLLAGVALETDQVLVAAQHLEAVPAGGPPLPQALCARIAAALHRDGHHTQAGELHEQLFRATQNGVYAYGVARAQAAIGDEDGAVAWLQEAVQAGWSDLHALDRDPAMAGLRALPAWPDLRALLERGVVSARAADALPG